MDSNCVLFSKIGIDEKIMKKIIPFVFFVF